MSQEVAFVIRGLGFIGQKHARLLQNMPGAKVVAAVETGTITSEMEKVMGQSPIFDSWEAFLNSGVQGDVVNICTPNGLHINHAHEAVEQGFHVVLEKPMGLESEACDRLLKAAQAANKQLFCVMQNRFSPPIQWLHTILEEGRLGTIYQLQINCYWNRDERYYLPKSWRGSLALDGGPLLTQFSHFIDILYWLFGDIKNVNARFYNHNHQSLTEFEDSGIVNFDLVQGGSGSIHYSTSVWEQNFESSITIIAEKGTVRIGGQYMDQVVYCNIEDYEMPSLAPTNPANSYGHFSGSANNHHFIFENVVATLNGKAAPAINPEDGCHVVHIIEQIYAQRTTPVLSSLLQ